MVFYFDFTRESADQWARKGRVLLDTAREWRAAILARPSDPAEVRRLQGETGRAAFNAASPGWAAGLWKDFAKEEPAIVDAVLALAEVLHLEVIGPDEAWGAWDGAQELPWMPVLEARLEGLKRALGDDPAAYEQVVTLDQARIFARASKNALEKKIKQLRKYPDAVQFPDPVQKVGHGVSYRYPWTSVRAFILAHYPVTVANVPERFPDFF